MLKLNKEKCVLIKATHEENWNLGIKVGTYPIHYLMSVINIFLLDNTLGWRSGLIIYVSPVIIK